MFFKRVQILIFILTIIFAISYCYNENNVFIQKLKPNGNNGEKEKLKESPPNVRYVKDKRIQKRSIYTTVPNANKLLEDCSICKKLHMLH